MNILFVTPRLPYPPYRGDKLYAFNLIKQLGRRHEIGLVSLIQDTAEEKYMDELSKYCSYIHLTYLPQWKSIVNCLAGIFSNVPFQVAYYRSSVFEQTLREALYAFKPDIIHSHLIRTVPYTKGISDVPRVLGLTDAVSLYLKRFTEQERNPLKRMLVRMEQARITKYEAVASAFDRALVCSAIDRDVILRHAPAAHVGLLYNGVDLDHFTPDPTIETEPGRIIFTGNMTYFPNIDAAQWLAGEILPLIRQRVANAKLYIVGQNPPSSVRSLQRDDVVVTGFVQDICAEYSKSVVAVSPVRFGAGTLNKVLEPLALGVPVVSTPIGHQTVETETGIKLEIAGDAELFADKVSAILLDPVSARITAAQHMIKVRERFSWETIAADLEKHFALAQDHFKAGANPVESE